MTAPRQLSREAVELRRKVIDATWDERRFGYIDSNRFAHAATANREQAAGDAGPLCRSDAPATRRVRRPNHDPSRALHWPS
jgi:hypothetical protein